MRNNTQRIYERLNRGEFLSVDSSDTSIRHLYEDIEENFNDYADFFKEIGLQLEAGNGYFFFIAVR
ncbi:condensin complex protein MksE [Bacteroides heparinolyticus]|uniref:condensin complex protein MksE n=1 Tax=Prevotella heparinolytica TaxID=28113 RepID=UPI00359F2E59